MALVLRVLTVALLATGAVRAGVWSHWRVPAVPLAEGDDPGEPLFLTPLIQSGNVSGAQALAAVEPLAGAVRSFSGFLTVDEKRGSNMFFWYFPAEQLPDTAPVLLWLQGGPGASSLFGLFTENGPFEVSGGKLVPRKYSWSKQYHLFYIDNPVGTGYSFTSAEEGYARNQSDVGRDLDSAVRQFFQLFPELQGREFFISGESYAGKYIPSLGYAIHKNNPTVKPHVNLQGLLIGNGLCDPQHMLVYSEYLFQLGLVDKRGMSAVRAYEDKIRAFIDAEKWTEAFESIDRLILGDSTLYPTLFTNLTGFEFYFNYLHTKDYVNSTGIELVQRAAVRRALHVGNSSWHSGDKVHKYLTEDMMKSVAPWLSELLDHYRIIVYNGQLDIIVGYPLSEHFLHHLSWTGADEWRSAPRKVWMVGNQVAGYAQAGGRMTQVLVRDAGHMVPTDQPLWALDLLNRFIANKPF